MKHGDIIASAVLGIALIISALVLGIALIRLGHSLEAAGKFASKQFPTELTIHLDHHEPEADLEIAP